MKLKSFQLAYRVALRDYAKNFSPNRNCKKKRKKQLAAFTKQRLRLDRKLHREIEDERRRCQLATSCELLQPWRNIHHPFRIHLHVSWRYARPPRIPQNPLEAVNLSAGRPIPVDIPDFINSSFAGLHSAY